MFNLANILSALNLLSGVCSVTFSFMGRLDLAVFAIFAGALLDFADGFVARKLGLSGDTGKQLDSLADIVTFGVAPGIMMMVIMMITVGAYMKNPYPEVIRYDFFRELELILNGTSNFYVPFIALLIPFLSAFRLAKFNTDDRQSDRFLGLPTPANTLFFTSFAMMVSMPDSTPSFLSDYTLIVTNPYVLAGLVIVMSILLVTEIPLFSLKFKHFGWNGNESRYIFLLTSLIFIVFFRTWSAALIVFLYLIFSLVENVIYKKT